MKEKFTPGPWEHAKGQSGLIRGIRAKNVNIVNFNGISRASSSEGQANARLIAAAPDMHYKIEAALKEWDILPRDRPCKIEEITDWLVRFMSPAMEELRGAIMKAGEKS